MPQVAKHFYEFGSLRLDPAKRVLLLEGKPLPLTAKVFDTLLLLVERRGQVVEKDELMKLLWPDSFVEEANLTQNVSILRKVLGESPNDHRYIVTVPGRGYRFVANVTESGDEETQLIVEERTRTHIVVSEEDKASPPRQIESALLATEGKLASSHGPAVANSGQSGLPVLARPRMVLTLATVLIVVLAVALIYLWSIRGRSLVRPVEIKSIAVLPLENLSADPKQEYFSDGMTDALITNLAQIGTLRVISRTSVMQYKAARKSLREIAKELNVGAVLEGTVLRSGDRVRISAQLIEADTDRHLWAKNYEGDMSDILKLQSEVSQAVAQEIRVKLTPSEKVRLAKFRPVKREAFEAYLRGTNDGDKSQLERAIKLDPEYAPAYTALARIYYFDGLFGELPPGESFPKMKTLALTGLQKDETLGEAHGWLALANLHYDWNWVEAEKEFRRALELNPSNADIRHGYAHYLLVMDRLNESMAESKRAIELNPFDTTLIACVGWHCLYSRQYDQTVEYCLKALAIDPTTTWAHLNLGWAYEQKSMFKEAIAEFKNVVSGWDIALTNAALGHGFAVSGDKRQAEEILAKLKERSKKGYVSPYDIAVVHQGLGDKDQAFEWLEKAYAERSGFLVHVKWDPRFASLHSDPRFQDLMRRIGLPLSDSRKAP